MLIADVRTQARRWGRMDATGASDAQVNHLISEAVTEFANDVGGFSMEKYPVVAAAFDTETHFAIRVTITGGTNALAATDVAITGTQRSGATGATVASDFQATLRTAIGGGANATVAWDDFAFTLDTIDGTEIVFAEPSDANYADARDLLGLTGTTSASSVTGSFPQDSTVEYTLPTDMIAVERVEWDGDELIEASWEMSPEYSGTPEWYYIRGRTLHFIPSPETQGVAKIWYRGVPADIVFSGYQECGLSGISDEASTGLVATTTYYYKVSINGSAATEYSITTASDVTFSAVIALMNAQNTGATWSIEGGDLRCTSDAVSGVSTIALSSGTSGTDLFATLTGFSAFDTAVAGDTAMPSEIPAMSQKAIAFLVGYYLLLESFDDKEATRLYGLYTKTMRQFRLARLARRTRPEGEYLRPLGYTVSS